MSRFRSAVKPLVLASVTAAVSAAAVALAPSASATTAAIYVGGPGASDSNSCTTAAAPCATVGQGVNRAFSAFDTAADVTIDIAPGTYSEAVVIPEVPNGDSVSLVGTAGAAATTIDASGTHAPAIVYPPFFIGSGLGGDAHITGLTVTGGTSPTSGGMTGYGAGIVNSGHMTVADSVVTGNNAAYGGGGLYNIGGTLTVSGTTVSNNHGGGITSLSGTLTVTSSQILNNVANGGGGGIESTGTLTVDGSTISGNSVDDSGSKSGGGIYNYGLATISNTEISHNTADSGAGIENTGGSSLTLTHSTVEHNTASLEGGGIDSGADLTITDSTIADNSAVSGGGLADRGGTATVTMSTFSGNTATTASNGGGIYNSSTALTVTSSILAGDTALGVANECSGNPVTNGGYNVTTDNTCGFGASNGSKVSTVAAVGLGALALNGATVVRTEAITATSSAHQVVPSASCAATDERGQLRPGFDAATQCDAGAYELQQTPSVSQTITFAGPTSPTAYGAAPITLSAMATSNLPVFFTTTGPCSVTGSTLTVTGVGNCVITAHQDGNRTYLPAPTVARTLVINKAPTTISLTASPSSTAPDQPVTLTATVHYSGSGAAPTGTVTLLDNGSPIGTGTLSGGTAQLTTVFGAGPHSLTASYGGDTNYNGSTSAPPLAETVLCDRTLTGQQSAVIVSSGTTCLVNATVSGSVTVARGASLDVENSTVQGSISGSGPAGLRVCGSNVGSVAVTGATGFVVIGGPTESCAGNTVRGSISATGDTAGTVIVGNTVAGAVITNNDTGSGPLGEPAVTVSGNHH